MVVKEIVSFIRRIGLACDEGCVPEVCFLPGISLKDGGIVFDPLRMTYPGDLLHEAGHLAVMPPFRRQSTCHTAGNDPGEEMMAIAWSYAAALHIGIDPAIVFHEGGYRSGSKAILENFGAGRYVGVPMLAWLGMTNSDSKAPLASPNRYPKMEKWLCLENWPV